VRIAGLLYIADDGFGIAMLITLAHLARAWELPMITSRRFDREHLMAGQK
jgi:hypothetical protein